jgi:hypothetical protein
LTEPSSHDPTTKRQLNTLHAGRYAQFHNAKTLSDFQYFHKVRNVTRDEEFKNKYEYFAFIFRKTLSTPTHHPFNTIALIVSTKF